MNVSPTSAHYLRYFCNGCQARGWGKKLLLHLLGPGAEGLVDGLLPRYQGPIRDVQVQQVLEKDHPLPESLLGAFSGWRLTLLEQAGFRQETLDHFGLGYDPVRDGYTFPIRDWKGVLVGIYFRRNDEGEGPKYLPYESDDFAEGLIPENYTFHKAHHVWNLHRVLDVKPVPVVVVEGPKACMWVHQTLGTEVRPVALLGTSMSRRQLQLLQLLGGPFLVLLDNSTRAISFAEKIAGRLRAESFVARAIHRYAVDVPQPDGLDEASMRETLWVS